MAVAVQEEALELDARPDATIYDADVTIRQLLSHASGITMDERRQVAAPGTRRIYSNAGIEVACEHLERITGISIVDYLQQAICQPLGLASTTLPGSPASGGASSATDLGLLAGELLSPGRVLDAVTVAAVSSVQFPGLRGVLPGFGHQDPNDWGLGMEIRAHKSPHWTSPRNSPTTFGHFGQSGTMMWIDPAAGLALVALADRNFGPWAASAWPALSDAVLTQFR
jgi:CubicO group peptidase (beta-lactamase class C family)